MSTMEQDSTLDPGVGRWRGARIADRGAEPRPRRSQMTSQPLWLALAMALLTFWAAPAQTQQRAELQERLEEAMTAYDGLELERAQRLLDDAIERARGYGSQDPVVADLYLMRGILEWAISGDGEAVRQYFVEGLSVDAGAQLDPYYTTPDLARLLEEARRALPEPEPPPEVLRHTPVVTVRQEQSAVLLAQVEPQAGVEEVLLHYRPESETQFTPRGLERRGPAEFVGEIPGRATREGVQMAYYLEALGSGGAVVGRSGSAESPHLVIILERPTGDEPGIPPSQRIGSVAVGAGTGGGMATGQPVAMGDEVDLNPGVALTPLHVFVDASFRVSEALEVGPFLRLQTVLLRDGVELEPLVGAKLKWFFSPEDVPLLYASLGGGYGYVRHTVDLSPTIEFVDTTREGPFHGGVGFGAAFLFSRHVGVVTDVYAMVLFDEVSVQLDLNLGLYLAF